MYKRQVLDWRLGLITVIITLLASLVAKYMNKVSFKEAVGRQNQSENLTDAVLSFAEMCIRDRSGGEKQKIACASSSVLLPGIMVLDEPSSNLDMAAIDDLRQVLSLWKKQGKTILIAEHRLYYLHDLADRVLYVKDGEIEREYTPAEFDSLSDGTRKEMGLRPFSLSKLKPANQYQAHTAKQMEFQNFS